MAPGNINPSKTRQVFVSGDSNHRIVRVPQNEVGVMANGQATGQAKELNPALAYQFEDGYLVIDDERRKADDRFFKRFGEQLEIDDRRPAEEWLREHALCGMERGFHEMPYSKPDSGSTLAEAMAAQTAGDVGRLVELYEEEEQGHGREDVLTAVKAAIVTLEERETAAAAAAQG